MSRPANDNTTPPAPAANRWVLYGPLLPLALAAGMLAGADAVSDESFVARDLADLATTAGELAVVLVHVGNALGETYAEGLPGESVCREAIKDLRDAQHRIAELIGELEREVGP